MLLQGGDGGFSLFFLGFSCPGLNTFVAANRFDGFAHGFVLREEVNDLGWGSVEPWLDGKSMEIPYEWAWKNWKIINIYGDFP